MELQDYFMIAEICNKKNEFLSEENKLHHRFTKGTEEIVITAKAMWDISINQIISYCNGRSLDWYIDTEENQVRIRIY